MIEIIPAILSQSDSDFHAKMKHVEGLSTWVQIDIMDGEFVPEVSISIDHIASYRHNFKLEMHLMMQHPLRKLDACARAGAKRIIFHSESLDDPQEIIRECERLGIEVGVALHPDTAPDVIQEYAAQVRSVQVMGVIPGRQGQMFIESVLKTIQSLRSKYPHMIIAVDGGVNQENIASIVHSGADRLIVGSALVNSPNPQKTLESLHEIARNTLR